MTKKIITGALLLFILSAVLFLALQGPQDTTGLSQAFYQKAKALGYRGTHEQFRSDIHLPEYFLVALAAILFCKAMGWSPWIGAAGACLFGLMEETLKIFLPTREFGPRDLLMDVLGAALALTLILLLTALKSRKKA